MEASPSPIDSWLRVNAGGEEVSTWVPGPLAACVFPWAFLKFGWAAPQVRVPGLLPPHRPQPLGQPVGGSALCVCVPRPQVRPDSTYPCSLAQCWMESSCRSGPSQPWRQGDLPKGEELSALTPTGPPASAGEQTGAGLAVFTMCTQWPRWGQHIVGAQLTSRVGAGSRERKEEKGGEIDGVSWDVQVHEVPLAYFS